MTAIRSSTIFAILAAATGLLPIPVQAQLSIGSGNATGGTALAISNGATGAAASGLDSIAIGRNSVASGAGGVAIGSSNSTNQATASGLNSVAIGVNARATAANATAIGSDSLATQANTVSVGSAGAERRVTNVAGGVAPTDAVNVSQLNAVAIGGAGPQVDALTSQVSALENRVDEVARNSYRGIAGVAAMAVAMPSAPGRTAVNFGVGAYEGYRAVGASVAHLSSNGRYNVSGGMSFSGGKSVTRIGAGFSF